MMFVAYHRTTGKIAYAMLARDLVETVGYANQRPYRSDNRLTNHHQSRSPMMNKADRAELSKAIELLNNAKEIVESIRDSEQEKYDNLSEGLQASERGQKIETASQELEGAANLIDDAISSIETASE